MSDKYNLLPASISTAGASVAWWSTLHQFLQMGASIAAIVAVSISVYKLIKERKND